jgi:hypothetical protein
MKQSLLFSLRMIVLAILGAVSYPTSAQTTANGPYYPMPAWDQKLQCDTLATCPRFIVLSNWNSVAVLDRETGLVWERSPSTVVFNWSDAQSHCNQFVKVGNRMGWRLPTIQELASLVDADPANTVNPRLPPGHPFMGVQSLTSLYWSATSSATITGLAWAVNFEGGNVLQIGKNFPVFTWCVRGGQGVDPQ